jgi:hypothetical protein
LVIPAKARIQVRGFSLLRSLDARVRGHDGTSLRLKARDFNLPRKGINFQLDSAIAIRFSKYYCSHEAN